MAPRRIALLGTGPLLDEGATVFSGQCLRTWHFAAPLIEAGHDVRIATVPIPGALVEDGDTASEAEYRGHRYRRYHRNDEGSVLPDLRAWVEAARPDVLLGVNQYPAYLLARLGLDLPLWADLNGWNMAEGQIRAASVGHDRDFGHFWRIEARVLLAADRFSAVSARQADALYGELAMLGRLNRFTAAEPFCHAIPNAAYPVFASIERREAIPGFLADRLPAGAKVCLWSGGFNSWTDGALLADGLSRALELEPASHFVATGGPVLGHDEETFQRIETLLRARFPAERTHLLGWIAQERMLELHACAGVGLSLDGANIEARFGARNRLTNMLAAGVPVVTTPGTEIADWIAASGAGRVVPLGDAAALGAALSEALADRAASDRAAARARELALRDFAPARTVAPLLRWLDDPRPAADRSQQARAELATSPPGRLADWIEGKCHEPLPFATPPPTVAPALGLSLTGRIKRMLRRRP